jgi:ABC-type transport system involved in multi-copper enzyme maturation permease subunit
MTNRIGTIARYTVLEALRTRLPVLTAVVVCTLLGASFFVREIAITESARFQTAFYAATIRFATVFLAALHVISSVSRELQDKGLDMVLALDLPRGHYLLGKLAGFSAIAAALALAVALPLLPLAGWEPVAQWALSLAAELAVVVALSLFCVITFNQLMPAASFVLAFYLLARALSAVRLISGNPVAGADSLSHQVMTWLVEGLALVVPGLDLWTRSEWLVDEPVRWAALAGILVQAALFVTLLTAAAAFDLYRRNF